MNIYRFYGAGPVAMATTFGLFLIMSALVGGVGEVNVDANETRRWIDVVQVIKDEPPKRKERIVPKPLIVGDPPEQIKPPTPTMTGSSGGSFLPAPPRVKPSKDIDTFGLATMSDGDIVPLVRVNPQYPQRAAERGIEGYVVVSLSVAADGSVAEESIMVIDAEPKGYFENEAIKAAKKFKFKPRVVDGVAYAVNGVRYSFSFNLSH